MRRDAFSMPLDLGRELIIDNFAGGGGTSTGLEAAFGRPVDIAINHDPEIRALTDEMAAMKAQRSPEVIARQEKERGIV